MLRLQMKKLFHKLENFNTLFFELISLSFFVLLMIVYVALIYASASPAWDTDYKYIYCLAKQALVHCSPYKEGIFFDEVLFKKTPMINLNSPFASILVAPFGLLSYPISFWAWSLQSLTLSICSACLIAKALFKQQKIILMCLIAALFVCTYFPTFANIKNGQIGALLFFFTTLGWVSYREKKLKLSGFFWGIAFSLKLFAGLFLWMFFIRREWIALKACLLTVSGCLLLSFLVFSPSVYIDYWHIFHQVHWYSSSWNASLLGFFSRLLGYTNEANTPLIQFSELTPILYGLSVAALFLLTLKFKKSTNEKNKLLSLISSKSSCSLNDMEIASRDLRTSYMIVAMLLISPLGWIYYFSLLCIPIAVIFYWNQRMFINFLLAIVVALSSAPYLLLKPGQITQNQDIFLQSGVYFYALFLLSLLIFSLNSQLKQGILFKSELSNSGHQFVLSSLCVLALFPSFLGIFRITSLIIINSMA